MSVRITYRTPRIGHEPEKAGKFQQKQFETAIMASDWIAIHIPEPERHLVKMWVDDIPLTGATLDAAIRPMQTDRPSHAAR